MTTKRFYEKNKDRLKEGKKQDYQKNKSLYRHYFLVGTYGITLEKYNELFTQQEGCCAICKKHQINFKRQLAVDHCHTTGIVRKLLCGSCNTHLGYYEKYKTEFEEYLA